MSDTVVGLVKEVSVVTHKGKAERTENHKNTIMKYETSLCK